MPESGGPIAGPPSPKQDIDVLPSSTARVGRAACTCKASLLFTDEKAREIEGQALATPPAEREEAVGVAEVERV